MSKRSITTDLQDYTLTGQARLTQDEHQMMLTKQAVAREEDSTIRAKLAAVDEVNRLYEAADRAYENEGVIQSYHLPTESKARKDTPICTGVLDYFPKALAEVARLSKAGNDKHNPGQPLHWSRGKSTDHADCIVRHMLDRGTVDEFGFLHEVSIAWRALAQLEIAIEKARAEGRY